MIQNFLYKKILEKFSTVAIGNLIQMAITFFITIYISKNLSLSDYGIYTIILTSIGLLSLTVDPILNPYFLREASKEYNLSKEIGKSLAISLSIMTFILVIIFLIKERAPFNQIIFEKKIILNLIIIFLSIFILDISKIINRIESKFYNYSAILIIDKVLLFSSIITISYISDNNIIINSIKLYSYSLFFFALFNLAIIINKFKLIRPNILEIKIFFKSIFFVYISTGIYFFISYEYFILILANKFINNELIGVIGLSYFFSNFIFFFIFWVEQTFSPRLIFIIDSNNENKKIINKYIEIFMNFNINLISFGFSIFLLLLQKTNIISLINNDVINYLNFFILFIFISISKSLDTLLGIIIAGLRIEKHTIFTHFFRLIVLLIAYKYLNDLSLLILIFIFVAILQNLYFILYVYYIKRIFNKRLITLIAIIMSVFLSYFFNLDKIFILLSTALLSLNIYQLFYYFKKYKRYIQNIFT